MSSTLSGIREGLSFILAAALFFAVIDFAVSPPSAVAQTLYKSDPIGAKFLPPDESAFDKTDRQQRMDYLQKSADYKRMRGEVDRLIRDTLRGTVDFNVNRAAVDEYFQQLALPEMTQADPRSLAQLGARRDGVMGALRDAPNGSPVRQYLVDQLLLPFAARVGMDAGYHSAVRLNAVLIAGLLNDRDGIRNVEPPTPSSKGLQFLLQVLADSASPAYLQIGALSGILRHAQIDGQLASKRMSAAQVQAITDFALATLQKTAEGAAADELYWMKRQSAQILGALRQPGSDGRVAAALRQLIQNADTPLWLGLDAVDAYGRLQFSDPAQADATATVQAVGAALSRWLAQERGEIDQYLISIKENKLLAERSKPEAKRAAGEEQGGIDEGIGAGGGIGGRGRGQASAASGVVDKIAFPNYRVNDARQKIKTILYVARISLDGAAPRRRGEAKPAENLKAVADQATARVIDQLTSVCDEMMTATDLTTTSTGMTDLAGTPQKTNDERLKQILKDGIGKLDRILGLAAPTPAVPAEPVPAALSPEVPAGPPASGG